MDRICSILLKSEREQAELISQHTTRFNKRQSKMPATSSASNKAPQAPPIQSPSLLFRSLASAHPPTPHTTVTQQASTSTQQQSIQDLNIQRPPPTRQVLRTNQNQPQPRSQRRPQRQPQAPLQFDSNACHTSSPRRATLPPTQMAAPPTTHAYPSRRRDTLPRPQHTWLGR
jgi:hypothetical protein